MKARTEFELRRIADFYGIELSPEKSATVIQRSSAERMREMEKTQGQDWVSTKGKRSDIPFVRSAKAGGWHDQLMPEAIAEIEAAWGNIMVQLGYELVTRKVEGVETVLAGAALHGEPRR